MPLRIQTGDASGVTSPVTLQEAYFQLSSVCHDGVEYMNLAIDGTVTFDGAPPNGTLAFIAATMDADKEIDWVIQPRHPTLFNVHDPDIPDVLSVPLCAGGAYAFYTPGNDEVDIFYDPTSEGPGLYRGYDAGNNEIPILSEHLLAFGMGWAASWFIQGSTAFDDPGGPGDYDLALALENQYRSYRFEPQRVSPRLLYGTTCPATPHKGVTQADRDQAGKPKKTFATLYNNCFVATAAYGGPHAPEVEFLRGWRDGILRQTRAGRDFFAAFYKRYPEFSVPLSEAMRADPELLFHMRTALAEPILRWLRLAVDFPDVPIEGVPEPWRSLLLETRSSLEEWACAIPAPESFDGLPPAEAARELGMFLRFMFRDPERRRAYIEGLEGGGQLPLVLNPHEARDARAALQEMGRPEREIERLITERR